MISAGTLPAHFDTLLRGKCAAPAQETQEKHRAKLLPVPLETTGP